MGHFTRVFCKSNNKPTVQQILKKLNSKGYSAKSGLIQNDPQSDNWTYFELLYKEGKLPILVELNKVEKFDGLANKEIEEFKEAIGEPGFNDSNKKKVLEHFDQSSFILCNQLPTTDIDHDGHNVNRELMKIFAKECEGIVQCDGEGFYSGGKLIIRE